MSAHNLAWATAFSMSLHTLYKQIKKISTLLKIESMV